MLVPLPSPKENQISGDLIVTDLTPDQLAVITNILSLFKGEQGLQGIQGLPGVNGVGIQGDKGDKGDKGDQGPKGTSACYSFADDFGADNTGVNPCDSAFAKVIAAGVKRLYIPGYYRFNNTIPISGIEVFGDGLMNSGFNSYTSLADGVTLAGPVGSITRLRDFTLQYKGVGQPAGKHGLRAMRKVYADSIQVKGFTNDGIYTDSIDGTIGGAAFFSRWDNVWAKNNGRDGFGQRFGANGHIHCNGQYDKNRRYGFHHYTDGGATYNTTITGGQACYNGLQGWMMESGTSIRAFNLYAEFNGSPTQTNTDGYTNTPFDYDISPSCNHSTIELGSVFSNLITHCNAPIKGSNDAVVVKWGGMRVFGSVAYKDLY
jgi:hypothetical protein